MRARRTRSPSAWRPTLRSFRAREALAGFVYDPQGDRPVDLSMRFFRSGHAPHVVGMWIGRLTRTRLDLVRMLTAEIDRAPRLAEQAALVQHAAQGAAGAYPAGPAVEAFGAALARAAADSTLSPEARFTATRAARLLLPDPRLAR